MNRLKKIGLTPLGKYLNLGEDIQTYVDYKSGLLLFQFVFEWNIFCNKVATIDWLKVIE